jgi:DNA-binding transcriptional ArsR family regulator
LITEGLLEKVAERFWVYGQRTRLLLIEQLADGKPSTPSELAQGLGLSQQSVSKHLKILSQAGIVTRRMDGSSALYSLKNDTSVALVKDVVAAVMHDVRDASALAAGLTAIEDTDRESAAGKSRSRAV